MRFVMGTIAILVLMFCLSDCRRQLRMEDVRSELQQKQEHLSNDLTRGRSGGRGLIVVSPQEEATSGSAAPSSSVSGDSNSSPSSSQRTPSLGLENQANSTYGTESAPPTPLSREPLNPPQSSPPFQYDPRRGDYGITMPGVPEGYTMPIENTLPPPGTGGQ